MQLQHAIIEGPDDFVDDIYNEFVKPNWIGWMIIWYAR